VRDEGFVGSTAAITNSRFAELHRADRRQADHNGEACDWAQCQRRKGGEWMEYRPFKGKAFASALAEGEAVEASPEPGSNTSTCVEPSA
jgi:hypothetical protein